MRDSREYRGPGCHQKFQPERLQSGRWMLDPFDLRSGQAVGRFPGSHGFQQTQRPLNRRARLDCESGFERADVGARGGDSASEDFC